MFGAWAGLLVLFYSLNTGITCTNDGGHFALADSLVTRGTAVLGDNAGFAGHDVAVYEGETFAGRDPGLGLFCLVFHSAFGALAHVQLPLFLEPWTLENTDDAQRRRLATLMLVSPLCGAAIFLAVQLLLRQLGMRPGDSACAALGLVLSTLLVRYCTVLYAHALTTALTTSGFVAVFHATRRPERCRRWLAAGGFLLASAVACEPLAFLLYAPVLGYVLLRRGPPRSRVRSAGLLAAGSAVPFLVIACFNLRYFGHPVWGAYFHHASYEYNRSLTTAFLPSPRHVFHWLGRLLCSPPPFTSVLCSSPILLLALGSAPLFLLRKVRWTAEHACLLSAFALVLVATAMYREPFGGYDLDYRYMLFVLPCVFPFAAAPLMWLTQRRRRGGLFLLALAFTACLLWVSARAQFAHLRHPLQRSVERRIANWRPAFVNTLPFVLAGAGVTAGIASRSRRKTISPRGAGADPGPTEKTG